MAVPKHKRYKQVVKTRRSLQKQNVILKKNLTITKFNNYASILTPFNSNNEIYCNICRSDKLTNKLCVSCYVSYFLNFFDRKRILKNINIKKKKNRNKYYYELSKTFFPPSRP